MTQDQYYKYFQINIKDARQIIERARSNAVRSVDFCRVQMYWNLGKRILEEEQDGKERADYGAYLIKIYQFSWKQNTAAGFLKDN